VNSVLIVLLGQVVQVLLKAVLKNPDLVPDVSRIIAAILPALSKATGETPEETEARRAAAEAIFAKWETKP